MFLNQYLVGQNTDVSFQIVEIVNLIQRSTVTLNAHFAKVKTSIKDLFCKSSVMLDLVRLFLHII